MNPNRRRRWNRTQESERRPEPKEREWELTDEELDRCEFALSTKPCKTFVPCGCMSGPGLE